MLQAQPLLDECKWNELPPAYRSHCSNCTFCQYCLPSFLQAQPLLDECKWSELVDPCIMDQKGGVSGIIGHGFKARVCDSSSLARVAQLAKACLSFDPLARPSMDEVAQKLQVIYFGEWQLRHLLLGNLLGPKHIN